MHLFLMLKRSEIYIKQSIYFSQQCRRRRRRVQGKPHKYMKDTYSGFIPEFEVGLSLIQRVK